MAPRFHKLTVTDIRQETPDCISIAFGIPEDGREAFAFRPGQNLVLRTRMPDGELRRNYSLCSSPLDGECRIAVKRLPGGRFSNWAHDHLRPGDTIDVLTPSGRFCPELPTEGRRTYVAFAAGSGITPVISILSHTLAANPDSRFLLVYGNRDSRHIIFREKLEALKNRYLQRLQVIHVLSREQRDADLHTGRIDAATCEAIDRSILPLATVDDFFLCGPSGMVETVDEYLKANGIDAARIHTERFHAPGDGKPATAPSDTPDRQTSHNISLRLDGTLFRFEAPGHGETLLDAAIRQGIDLPFACKGGMCGTCRARLLSGEVRMDHPFALEPEELRQGFILTCQSHPTTPELTIDFDAR
jgi:ring-1,2-phenylacetyl-CoA epoxidase subunit PaaE